MLLGLRAVLLLAGPRRFDTAIEGTEQAADAGVGALSYCGVDAQLREAMGAAMFALEARHGNLPLRDEVFAIWPSAAPTAMPAKAKNRAGDEGDESEGTAAPPWVHCLATGLTGLPELAGLCPRADLAGLIARLADHPRHAVADRAIWALTRLATEVDGAGSGEAAAGARDCAIQAAAAVALALFTQGPSRFPPAVARLRALLEARCSVAATTQEAAGVGNCLAGGVVGTEGWAAWTEAAALMSMCSSDAAARLDGIRIARLCRSIRRGWPCAPAGGDQAALADLMETGLAGGGGSSTASTPAVPCAALRAESGDGAGAALERVSEGAADEGDADAAGTACRARPRWAEVVFETGRLAALARPDVLRVVWRTCSTRAAQLLAAVEAARRAGADAGGL